MESKFQKHYNYLIFGIILLIFCVSFFQMSSQHWSSHFDSDWFNIYNILLLKSGFVQDFYDHPAFTLFFINSILLKIFGIFNNSINLNIQEIHNVANLDVYFEKIFYLARIINSIFHCASIYFIHLIFVKFNVNKIISILLILLLIFSNFFFINLFQIRPEIISVFFILSSFFLFIKFSENKNLYLVFFSGFLMGLAYISKIQIIFFIFFIAILIPLSNHFPISNIIKYEEKNNNLKFKFLIFLYLIISFIYIILEIFVIYDHERYVDHNKIDLYGFIIFNFLYFIYLKLILGNTKKDLKFNISCYIIYFAGFISTVIFLIIIHFINIAPVNHNIYFKFLNPYYFLSTRSIDVGFFDILINFFKLEVILNNKFLLFSLLLIIPYLFKFQKIKLFNLILSFGLLLLTIFSNNLRYFELYEIYTFIAFLFFFIFLDNKKLNNFKIFLLSTLLIFTIQNTFFDNKFSNYFNRVSFFENCDTKEWILLKNKNGLKEWLPWTKKFDEKFYQTICSDILANNS